jgi:hypothetical protein
VAENVGGKDYYSIAPNYEEFFEFLRGIAGDPAVGTTGRSLPRFNPVWLKVWVEMVGTKIGGWQRKRKRAEAVEAAVKGETVIALSHTLTCRVAQESSLRTFETAIYSSWIHELEVCQHSMERLQWCSKNN